MSLSPPGTSRSDIPSLGRSFVDRRMLAADHHTSQYEASRLVASYHRLMLRIAVRMAQLQRGMRVLDYGCGGQMLRHELPAGVAYTGFDLTPDLTDVSDPRGSRYDVVFAVQMMMYVSAEGLVELTDVFAGLTSHLVVMVPARNFIKDQLLDRALGLKRAVDETGRSRPVDIYRALSRRFERLAFRRFFWVSEFTHWRVKPGFGR